MGLRKLDYERLVSVSILSAAFFVGSLIHVPIGPTSAHLILNGLLGAMLGWASFPAILVALGLQAVLFQFGGVTVLGVNTFNMAAPSVACFYLFRPMLRRSKSIRTMGAFLCGSISVLLAALLTALSLAMTDEGFIRAAQVLFLAHIPVMLIEGGLTAMIVAFLTKAKPDYFSDQNHGLGL
jgi:cobalt/nickel transport system permease protein